MQNNKNLTSATLIVKFWVQVGGQPSPVLLSPGTSTETYTSLSQSQTKQKPTKNHKQSLQTLCNTRNKQVQTQSHNLQMLCAEINMSKKSHMDIVFSLINTKIIMLYNEINKAHLSFEGINYDEIDDNNNNDSSNKS